MVLKQCKIEDFLRVTEFYKYSIENNLKMKEYCPWVYGKHPTDDMIKFYIENGFLFYLEEDKEIIAASALTSYQDKEYREVNWGQHLKDDEVSVVHILCVSPKKRRCGVAKRVVKELITIAKDSNKRGVRLDALCTNKPAHSLYESLGFNKCDKKRWYAENTGWIDFFLYEMYF